MGRTVLLAAAGLALLTTTSADAHFKLNVPTSSIVLDAIGDPQKTGPCGGTGTATNAITTVMTGSMMTISIDETIFHPGHYRIAIAQNLQSLPAPPPVTPGGGDPCNSVPIAANPTLPVLADGVFAHTTQFSGTQTTQIQLPTGFQCNSCVMQVLQYMKNHAAPCFYYHCATVTISDSAPPPVDGPPSQNDAGTGGGAEDIGGCCDTRSAAPAGSLVLALVAFATIVRRRRHQ